jgi:hypothetical protein
MNDRITQLNRLAGNIPVVNQQIANGMQQARVSQLQQTIAGMAPDQAGTTATAQQLGAQQAQQSGAIQAQAATKTNEQVSQVGQMALQQDKMAKNQELFTRQQAITQKNRAYTNQLASLDNNLKDQLLDQQLSFKTDEFGRTLWNERQLADYAVLQATSQVDLDKFEQTVNQQSQRRMQILQTAQAKIKQALEQNFMREGQALDQQTRMELARMKQQAEAKIRREKNKRNSRAAMFQGGLTILGAGLGAAVPVIGPAAGAMVGGGLGQILSSEE